MLKRKAQIENREVSFVSNFKRAWRWRQRRSINCCCFVERHQKLLHLIHIVMYSYEIGKAKYMKTERFIYTMPGYKVLSCAMNAWKYGIAVCREKKHISRIGLTCTFLMGFLPPITECMMYAYVFISSRQRQQ